MVISRQISKAMEMDTPFQTHLAHTQINENCTYQIWPKVTNPVPRDSQWEMSVVSQKIAFLFHDLIRLGYCRLITANPQPAIALPHDEGQDRRSCRPCISHGHWIWYSCLNSATQGDLPVIRIIRYNSMMDKCGWVRIIALVLERN